MAGAPQRFEHRPMQSLRASAIALPFVAFAVMVWALSVLLGSVR
jgi:hypothetical protein